ncbi:MAG: helix-turn-helix transcriptional regulator [Clostridia bacterium]|nr:helix-turn-helix transcriptional regulator [Clostridia bacterium]
MRKIIFGENKNIIHRKLRAIRIQRGLTQGEVAAKLQTMNINIDQQMISKIENNDRIVTDYELCCIAAVLKVEVKELLDGETIV